MGVQALPVANLWEGTGEACAAPGVKSATLVLIEGESEGQTPERGSHVVP